MTTDDKINALRRLGRERQRTRYDGYSNIGDYHEGRYDGPQVSPYTRGAGNVDSPVLLMLQDWWSESKIKGDFDDEVARLGRKDGLPTNRNLQILLQENFGVRLGEVYATNLFPFIKKGGISSAIPRADIERTARQFSIEEISIVQPILVVCLGVLVFSTLHLVLRGERAGLRLSDNAPHHFDHQFAGGGRRTRFWAQAHPGGLGCASRGGLDGLRKDWAPMAEWFATAGA